MATDFAKLAQQFGGKQAAQPAAAGAPAATGAQGGGDLASLAAQFGGQPLATFKTRNAVDEQGQPQLSEGQKFVASPTIWAGEKVLAALDELKTINPVEFNRFVQSAFWHPLVTLKGIYQGRKDLSDAALAAFKKGDLVTGAAKAAEWLVPLVGERMSQAGDLFQKGEFTRGMAATTDAVLPVVFAKMGAAVDDLNWTPHGTAGPAGGRPRATLSPEQVQANEAGAAQGVPFDAATATGSRVARTMQKRVANSMGGEGAATEMLQAQRDAMQGWGRKLADQTGGSAADPVTAGEGVQTSVGSGVARAKAAADRAYGRLRQLEADPANRFDIVTEPTQLEKDALRAKQQSSLGHVPKPAVVDELKDILYEMENDMYEGRHWRNLEGDPDAGGHGYGNAETAGGRGFTGNAGGGKWQKTPGHAGAAVFNDILDQMTDGTSTPARADLARQIRTSLETGQYSNFAKAALKVAEKRLQSADGMSNLGERSFPKGSGADVLNVNRTRGVGLAIDLGGLQKGKLADILSALDEQREAGGGLHGSDLKTYLALKNVVKGEPVQSFSIADDLRSQLLELSRSDNPALRSRGQGLAAKAAAELGKSIDESLAYAPAEAKQALATGRAATRAKYKLGELGKEIDREPVGVFKRITAPGDGGIKMLRRLKEATPESVPDVARAWLEERLEMMGREKNGLIAHADAMYRDWSKLGRQTKSILFPSPGQAAELDNFFLLAKRLAENPNPSGTAHTLSVMNLGSAPATYALAKVLYTKRGVQALTRVLQVEAKIPVGGLSKAARVAAFADLVQAAEEAGIELPMAADKDDQRSQRSQK